MKRPAVAAFACLLVITAWLLMPPAESTPGSGTTSGPLRIKIPWKKIGRWVWKTVEVVATLSEFYQVIPLRRGLIFRRRN